MRKLVLLVVACWRERFFWGVESGNTVLWLMGSGAESGAESGSVDG